MAMQWIPRATDIQIQYNYVTLYTKTMLGNAFQTLMHIIQACSQDLYKGDICKILNDNAH